MDVNRIIADWMVAVMQEVGDPTPLWDKADAYREHANTVIEIQRSLSAQLNNLVWDGDAADAHRAAWREHIALVADASALSDKGASALTEHANAAWRTIREIVGILVEIIEIMAATLAFSWLLGQLAEVYLLIRTAPLIRTVVELVRRVHSLTADIAAALRAYGSAAARITDALEGLTTQYFPRWVRDYAIFYQSMATPNLLSGRPVPWRDNAWKLGLVFGFLGPLEIAANVAEATTVGLRFKTAVEDGAVKVGALVRQEYAAAVSRRDRLGDNIGRFVRARPADVQHPAELHTGSAAELSATSVRIEAIELDGTDTASLWADDVESALDRVSSASPRDVLTDGAAVSRPARERAGGISRSRATTQAGRDDRTHQPSRSLQRQGRGESRPSPPGGPGRLATESGIRRPGGDPTTAHPEYKSRSREDLGSLHTSRMDQGARSADSRPLDHPPRPSNPSGSQLPSVSRIDHRADDPVPAGRSPATPPARAEIQTSESPAEHPINRSPDEIPTSESPAQRPTNHPTDEIPTAESPHQSPSQAADPPTTPLDAITPTGEGAASPEIDASSRFVPMSGPQSCYAGLRETVAVAAANAMAAGVRKDLLHERMDAGQFAAEVVGGAMAGPMTGAYRYLKVGERFAYRNSSPEATTTQRWSADIAIRFGFASSFFVVREPVMWILSSDDIPPTELNHE